jgi:hypothetical protein
MSRVDEPRPEWLLSGAVLAALIAWALASILLHIDNLRVYGLVLAIGASIDIRTRAVGGPRESTGVVQYYGALLRPVWSATLVACVVFLTVASATIGPFAFPRRWTVTEMVGPVASTAGTPVEAYTLTVQTRDSVSLTYLALLADPALQRRAMTAAGLSAEERAATTISATPTQGGIIRLSIDADSNQVANVALGTLPATVDEAMNRPQPLYHFTVIPGSRTAPTLVRSMQPTTLAASTLAAFLAAFASFLLVGRRQAPAKRAASTERGRQRETSPVG